MKFRVPDNNKGQYEDGTLIINGAENTSFEWHVKSIDSYEGEGSFVEKSINEFSFDSDGDGQKEEFYHFSYALYDRRLILFFF